MIDISEKEVVKREAIAEGFISLKKATINAILDGKVKKGNVIEASKIAGVLGAKMTPQIIPHCHPVPLESVSTQVEVKEDRVTVTCTVKAQYKTGVEMEALTCVNSMLLTIWDMVKYMEKDKRGQYLNTEISGIKVQMKKKSKD
ncbi:MAG: cyclic pyranopterin monophosphate synthase MoaC [Thermoplasmatales archaeon]|jgi:cyclic pyranopterin phosphate synthase